MKDQNPFGKRYEDAHLSKVILPEDTIKKINDWAKDPKNFLIFIGTPGLGKTYLCAALYRAMKERNEKNIYYTIRYFTENTFLSKLRQTIEMNWDYNQEIQTIAECDFLILDDIFSREPNEWQKEVLFNLIDHRYNSGLPMIITSNVWLRDMETSIGYRFTDRLKDRKNCIIEMKGVSKRIEPCD